MDINYIVCLEKFYKYVTIGGIGILLSPHTQSPLNNIEMITERIMIAAFNYFGLLSNPKFTLICCYSPTNNTSPECDVKQFYDELSSLTNQIPKHNIKIFADKLGKSDGYQHDFHEVTNEEKWKISNGFSKRA